MFEVFKSILYEKQKEPIYYLMNNSLETLLKNQSLMVLRMNLLQTRPKVFAREFVIDFMKVYGEDQYIKLAIQRGLNGGDYDELLSLNVSKDVLFNNFDYVFIDEDLKYDIFKILLLKKEMFIKTEGLEEKIKNIIISDLKRSYEGQGFDKDEILSGFLSNNKGFVKDWIYDFEKLLDFELNESIIKNDYMVIQDADGFSTIYLRESVNLRTLGDLSSNVLERWDYRMVGLRDMEFNRFYKVLSGLNAKIIQELKLIKTVVLKTYFINILNSSLFGDLMLSANIDANGRTLTNNFSVKYKDEYRNLEINAGITNVDDIIIDLITLGIGFDGEATDGSIRVGNASFRVAIYEKGGTFSVSIRKNEGTPMSGDRIQRNSGILIDKHLYNTQIIDKDIDSTTRDFAKIVEDFKLAGNPFLNPYVHRKHYDINFPMPYSNEDNNTVINEAINSTGGIFFIGSGTGNWKTTSIQNIFKVYIEHFRLRGINKNVISFENPIEGINEYIKQIEVSDTKVEGQISDFEVAMMMVKRMNPDIVLVGELRNGKLYDDLIEISDTAGVFTTLHVWSVEKLIAKLKGYSHMIGKSVEDGLGALRMGITQRKIRYEKDLTSPRHIGDYVYLEDDFLGVLLHSNNLLKKELDQNEIKLKKVLTELSNKIYASGRAPISRFYDVGVRLEYEMCRRNDIKRWMDATGGEKAEDIYMYMGYENSQLYKIIDGVVNGAYLIDEVSFTDNSVSVITDVINFYIKHNF